MTTDVGIRDARVDAPPEWLLATESQRTHIRRATVLALTIVALPFLWLAATQYAGPMDGTRLSAYSIALSKWAAGAPVERVQGDSELRPGDIVTSISERDVASLDATGGPARRPGDVVRYEVIRGAQRIELDVRLRRFDALEALLADVKVFTVPFVLLAIAAFVCIRRPHELPAWLLLMIGVFLLAGTAAWPLGLRAIDLGGGRGMWPFIGAEIGYCFMWATFLHFALVFPHAPRAFERRPWLPVGCYVLPFALYVIGRAFDQPTEPVSPLAQLGHTSLLSAPAGHVYPALLIVAFVGRYRGTTDPGDRRRLRYVVGSVVIALLVYVMLGQVPNTLSGRPLISWDVLQLVFLVCPLAIATAILRAQLFDIQVMARTSLIFGLLTGGLLALAVAVLVGLSAVFPERSPAIGVIAGCAVALCFHPLRSRLRQWVGSLVFRTRRDPYQVVSDLGRLDPGADSRAALQRTVETLADTLRLAYVSIELAPGQNNAFQRTAVTGRRHNGETITIPLGSSAQVSGRLQLEMMPGRGPFGRADRRLLGDVASQVGRLTDLALLNASLRQSRARIIGAREEERRQLHRDLHDGIGPSLAAQAMRLDLARELLASDRAQADEVLAGVGQQTTAIIADLRRVVDNLRPQALDQLGLVSGIRERCRGFSIAVEVIAPDALPELPAAVEVAAYRIAMEAVNNAASHSSARSCRVELSVVDDELALAVSDDGIGLATAGRGGAGLGSMRERAEELGGRFATENTDRGKVLIRAVIPLAPLRNAATS